MIERLSMLVRKQLSDVVTPLAEEIAQQSLEDVRNRLGARIGDMSPAEARGYVSACGRRVVACQSRVIALQHGGVATSTLRQAKSIALKHVVDELVRELLTKSTPEFARRAA